MKITTTVRLFPENKIEVLKMIKRFNHACNILSEIAFEKKLFSWLALQRMSYRWLRQKGFSSSQAVVIARKVAYAYSNKSKRNVVAKFSDLGAIPIYRHSYKRDGTVLIYGIRMPFAVRSGISLSGKNEGKLVFRNGKFLLHQVYVSDENSEIIPSDWLGCDLGIVNVLVDSDGGVYSGTIIENNRRKYLHRRRNLQRNGSRAAKRKLKLISKGQSFFQRNINHIISKNIVAKAKDTSRGIVLENLKGIRRGITVRKVQRARFSNWSFFQLQRFIEYKARLMGIPVVFVNPRNTSRKCPKCGYTDKNNRINQAIFKCLSCGFAGLADNIAALNIRARALDDTPMVTENISVTNINFLI